MNSKLQKGFSLLEIMIAVLVLAIGLLGMAAMQAVAMSSNQEAQFRVQALAIAEDLASRMRANREYVNASEHKYPDLVGSHANYNAYSVLDYNAAPAAQVTPDTALANIANCDAPVTTNSELNCRATLDVQDIRRQINPITSGRLLPDGSLMFVDCNDKLNLNYLDVDDTDNCSPGSVYTIYIMWPKSASRSDAGQTNADGSNRQTINARCAARLVTYNAASDPDLLPTDAGCLLMDIAP